MSSISVDAPAPKAGPAFLRLSAWPYRAEMALAAILLFGILFVWRLVLVGDLDVLGTVFWFLWPDLGAFLPIGVAMRMGAAWPRWGSAVYNVLHSFLPWAAVFAGVLVASGQIPWPLFGWAGHIALDRAVGYYLRAPAAA